MPPRTKKFLTHKIRRYFLFNYCDINFAEMTARCILLDLPPEIRSIIYDFVFEGICLYIIPLQAVVSIPQPKFPTITPALLLTCKQIYYEWKIPHRDIVLSVTTKLRRGAREYESMEETMRLKLTKLGSKVAELTTRLTIPFTSAELFLCLLNKLQPHPLWHIRRATLINVTFTETLGSPDDSLVNDWVATFPFLQRLDIVLRKLVWTHAKTRGLPSLDYYVAPIDGSSSSTNWFERYRGAVLLDHFMPIDRATRLTCIGIRRYIDENTGDAENRRKEEHYGSITHVHVFCGGPNELNRCQQKWENKCPTSVEPPLNLIRPRTWNGALEYDPSQEDICIEHCSRVKFSKEYGEIPITEYLDDYSYRIKLKRRQNEM